MDGFIPKVVCGKGSGQATKVVSGKDVSGVEGESCVRFVVAGAWRSGLKGIPLLTSRVGRLKASKRAYRGFSKACDHRLMGLGPG